MNLNHENSISENFLGEEQNFPGFGPSALILGNFVPHLENFRKYYIFAKNNLIYLLTLTDISAQVEYK